MQTVTFMGAAGKVAQYTVYDAIGWGEYHWSTDDGDSGSETSELQAQTSARMTPKSKHGFETKDGSDDSVPIRREAVVATRRQGGVPRPSSLMSCPAKRTRLNLQWTTPLERLWALKTGSVLKTRRIKARMILPGRTSAGFSFGAAISADLCSGIPTDIYS